MGECTLDFSELEEKHPRPLLQNVINKTMGNFLTIHRSSPLPSSTVSWS